MGLLDGKAAIVTGSARGIGRATAELFVSEGAKVLINDLDADVAEQTAGEIDGDTAVFGAYDATVCGVAFFGAGHVLFASDAPFDPEKGPMYIRETIAIIDRLPLDARDRERIYWRNAVQLLKL